MHLLKNQIISLVYLCVFSSCIQQKKFNIPGQDSTYAIQTFIDSNDFKKYEDVFSFEGAKKENVNTLRASLKPYVDKEDPYAFYFYAKTYDLFTFGTATKQDGDTALLYYQKAATKNLASADYKLYNIYRYSFMNIPEDPVKSLAYLQKAILHGNKGIKSLGYTKLAEIYAVNNEDTFFSSFIKSNKDSCIFYLQKAISLDPKNKDATDYLNNIYKANTNN